MASSQVEIASSSPFGCVLRDHNRRDGFRESKWRKLAAKDRLAAFVSVKSDETENSWPPTALQVPGNGDSRDRFSPVENGRASVEMDCSGETSNLGAASLVQIWEKRLNRCNSDDNDNAVSSVEEQRDSGQELDAENSALDDERFHSLLDLNSDRSLPTSEQASPCRSRGSDAGEGERVRVADIIKRLTSSDSEQSGSPSAASEQAEQPQPAVMPLRIRGRQAIADLLMQMERERHGELGALVERRTVSRFSHKGRIQSMLRLRSLARGLAVQERHRLRLSPASTATTSWLSQGSLSITHLRERFSSKSENAVTSPNGGDADIPRSPRNYTRSITEGEKLNEQTQLHEVIPIPKRSTAKVHGEVLGQDKGLVLQEAALSDRNFVSRRMVDSSEAAACSQFRDGNLGTQETKLEGRNFVTKEAFDCSKFGGRNLDPQETSFVDRIPVSPEAVNGLKAATCSQFENANLDSQEKSLEDRIFYSKEAFSASKTAGRFMFGDRNLNPQIASLVDRAFVSQEAVNASKAATNSTFRDRNLDPQETSLVDKNLVPPQVAVDTSEAATRSNIRDRNLGLQEMSLADRHFVSREEEVNASEAAACSKLGDRNLGPQETGLVDSQAEVNTSEAATCSEFGDQRDVAEEVEDNYMQYYEDESGYDWISEISRPRSYWEDRRQEWYYEMLNSNSKNGEIRQLLERGTVSGFLASEFRERMDSLMTSRLEIQMQSMDSQGGEEEDERNRLVSLMKNSREKRQQNEPEEERNGEEELGEEKQGEREEESLINSQVHEASDFFDQSTSSLQVPSPTLLRTWSFRDNEADDDSEQATSTSPCHENLPSQSYYENERECSSSSVNHPSIEMELICELRGHMEQLYHEMSDLRKSLKSCMDMQMILMQQQSMKQEVQSAAGKAKNKAAHGQAAPKKGNCCICYETKIDSLLYRCGHMCTCVKCGHELQWRSGKCPICCAPIVDVVRAHLDM